MAFLARELTNGYGLNIDSVSPSTARKVFELVAEGETNEPPYINWDTAVEDFLAAGANASDDPDGVDTMAFIVGEPFSGARPELKVRGYSVVPYPMNRKKCRIIVRYSTRTTSFSGGRSRRAGLRNTYRRIVIPTYHQFETDKWVQGSNHEMIRPQLEWRDVILGALPTTLEAVLKPMMIFGLPFLRIGYELTLLATNQWAFSEVWIHEPGSEEFTPYEDALMIPEVPAFHGIDARLAPNGPEYTIQGIEETWGEPVSPPPDP